MNQKTIAIICLIMGASLLRFIPHPPNMTPVIAISVLAVAHFKQRWLQFGLPLVIMLLTDAVLGFHSLVPVVYGAIGLAGLSGYILKRSTSFLSVLGSSLLASIIFFVITNAGVWAIGTMYPKTVSGLITCFVAAIPFFHNTLIATVALLLGETVVFN